MKNRVFRILVTVILVCCLVVSWSPIRVQASALPEVASVVTKVIPLTPSGAAAAGGAALGAQVFGWVLLGLGIVVTTAQAIDLMNQYTEFTGELETSIYYYPDGSWSYGVDIGFIERVRAFLFDSGVLSQSVASYTESTSYWGDAFITRPTYRFSMSYYDESLKGLYYYDCCVIYGSSSYQQDGNVYQTPFSFSYTDAAGKGVACGVFRNAVSASHGGFYAGSFANSSSGIRSAFINAVISVLDLMIGGDYPTGVGSEYELGTVAPLEIPMPDAYPEWRINARPATDPDTQEEMTVLPIPLDPNTEELPDGATQADSWQGSVADPLPDTGTDTGSDTGTDTDGSLSNTPWETFKKWISTGWESIIQAIPTPDSIAEAVGNVIKSIFVPDADFISDKWNDIRSRFEFADSITATGEVLVDILDGLDPEPPVIYIDLGATEGSYNLGGEVPFIDLRWYARYKPTMDLIISAFLWLAFVWRLILKLPGIISGMPGEFVLMNLPVNLPHLGLGSGQRREELEAGRNNRRLGDGH